MILGDNMDAILISYHGVSDGYIKVVVDILKNHNFFIAPQSIIDDETVTIREYIYVPQMSIYLNQSMRQQLC